MKLCNHNRNENRTGQLKICDKCYYRAGVASCDGKVHYRKVK